jgi:hypothetical protein
MWKRLVRLFIGQTVVKVNDCSIAGEISAALENAVERYLVPDCGSAGGLERLSSYRTWCGHSDWRL